MVTPRPSPQECLSTLLLLHRVTSEELPRLSKNWTNIISYGHVSGECADHSSSLENILYLQIDNL